MAAMFTGSMESAMALLLDASSVGWATVYQNEVNGGAGLTAATYIEQAFVAL